MKLPENIKVGTTRGVLPAEYLAQVKESETVTELGQREETTTIFVAEAGGKLLAYAVAGPSDDGYLMIFAARSYLSGLGALALKSLFGASQIAGKPLRVHCDQLESYARMMGAGSAMVRFDVDGIKQGIFSNGQ